MSKKYVDPRWRLWVIYGSGERRLQTIRPQFAVSEAQALHKARRLLGPIEGLYAKPLSRAEEREYRRRRRSRERAKAGQLELFPRH